MAESNETDLTQTERPPTDRSTWRHTLQKQDIEVKLARWLTLSSKSEGLAWTPADLSSSVLRLALAGGIGASVGYVLGRAVSAPPWLVLAIGALLFLVPTVAGVALIVRGQTANQVAKSVTTTPNRPLQPGQTD